MARDPRRYPCAGSFKAIFAASMIILGTLIFIIPLNNQVSAQNTQIPQGWVKFNPHSHGLFDVHDENGTVVGTIDESYTVFPGNSTGHTISQIRDKFGGDGVMVHTPHGGAFEPYKAFWEAEKNYENTQYSTTTNVTLGLEYNLNGRHIGLLNLTYFRSTNDYTTFKDLRQNITSQGAVMIINHPSDGWIGNPQIFLQPGYEFDAMEIYNGRVEILGSPLAVPQTDGRTHYRNAVTQGRLLAAIGGSDAHNTQSNWQVYTVAEDPYGEKNLDAVVRAIKNRRTYAASYDMGVYDRSFFLECHEMGQVIDKQDFTINVSPPSSNPYKVDLFRNNETSPVQSWSLSGNASLTYTIPDQDARDNAAYTFEMYEGTSPQTSSAIVYTSAIWFQPDVDYNISLPAGWNLVSIPLILENLSIIEVLYSISGNFTVVQWFDPNMDSWRTFPGDEFELNNKISFWIHMKNSSVLRNTGKMPFYTEIPLSASSKNGWNMVGFPAQSNQPLSEALFYIQNRFDALETFNSVNQGRQWNHFKTDKQKNDLLEFSPGCGYWIRVIEDCDLVIFN